MIEGRIESVELHDNQLDRRKVLDRFERILQLDCIMMIELIV